MTRYLLHFVAVQLVVGPFLGPIAPARCDILATNVFFNTVDLYDEHTGQLLQPGLFAPDAGPGEVLYLADVVVNPVNNHAFVSANFADASGVTRIYHFDAITGNPLPSPNGATAGVFIELDGSQFNPAGLALDANGDLYVANQGGITVDRFDGSGSLVRSYGDGGQSILLPGGLAFDQNGDLFVSNFGTGSVVKVDVTTGDISPGTSPGVNGPLAPNGVLVGQNGEIYVADVFGNGVFKYAADGTEITAPGGGPFVEIDLPNIPSTVLHPNAPSGLAFDENDDLLVAVLGPTNPFRDGENHGALLRFDSDDGSPLQEIALELPPAGGLARIAVVQPRGDFNGDDIYDVADIDALIAATAAGDHDVTFDLTGDDLLNLADRDAWLAEAAAVNLPPESAYLVGDANLDGAVESADLNNLALHWMQEAPRWSAGDFTADGAVNAADLNALALNWRKAMPVLASPAVPEPSGITLCLCMVLLSWSRTRCRGRGSFAGGNEEAMG